jgi:hypothetical protein
MYRSTVDSSVTVVPGAAERFDPVSDSTEISAQSTLQM